MKGETESEPEEANSTVDVSSSKSKFAHLRANLEKSGNVNICSAIDDFYRQQKASKVGDTKKKGEAASQLHHFRGSVDDVISPTKKSTPIRNPGVSHEENGAANRAAAALFVGKSPKRTTSKANGSGTIVRSLGEFYSLQRAMRRNENATRQKAADLYHGYSGLVSRADPAASYVVRSPIKAVSDTVTKINEASHSVPKFNLTDPSTDPAIENPMVVVDYKRADYRAFVFAVHDKYGLLLLHCTRKPKKGPHFQLAGGHVDEAEFLAAAKQSDNANGQLLYAAKMGAARELYEETGMDVRSQLDRLEPAVLRRQTDEVNLLNCELSKRLYFYLSITDADFTFNDDSQNLKAPMTENGNHLRLRLSIEHSGFVFESDPQKSAKMLEKHSGGNGSKALLMSILSMKEKENKTGTVSTDNTETQIGDSAIDSHTGENDVDAQNSEKDTDTQTTKDMNEKVHMKDISTSESSFIENPVVAVDFEDADYRGFVFVVHEAHGLMLLHCTSKAKKGPHYQLPGGHIDEPEFLAAAQNSEDAHAQLMIAAQMGAARELFEETGIDVREDLYRLEPAALRSEIKTDKSGKLVLTCELKKRLYFFLPVTDEDYVSLDSVNDPSKLTAPMTEEGSHLRLLLSNEHSGFMFEKNPEESAKLLEQHSGGNGSKALLMALNRDAEEEAEKGLKNEETQGKAELTTEDSDVDPETVDQKEKEEGDPEVMDESEVQSDALMDHEKEDGEDDTSGMEATQMTGEPTTEDFDYETQNQHHKHYTIKMDERRALLPSGSREISFEHLPCDLLPPPERKNIFSCCLFCGTKE